MCEAAGAAVVLHKQKPPRLSPRISNLDATMHCSDHTWFIHVGPYLVQVGSNHMTVCMQAKEAYEMDADEKLTKAASCKDLGTEAFKQQKHVRACKLWHRAMKPIEHDDQFSVEEKRRAREIKKGCNLNLAAAELKLGQHKAAVASCDKVSRLWVQAS